MTSVGAILSGKDLDIDAFAKDYCSFLDGMETPDNPKIYHPIFDEVKQRCFYIDISKTPYLDSSEKYMNMQSACFYGSYADSGVKMCNAAWEIFKPYCIEYISLVRKHSEGTMDSEEYAKYSLILMHATQSYSQFPRSFERAAENVEIIADMHGGTMEIRNKQEYLALLAASYEKDADWHVEHFRQVRSGLLQLQWNMSKK